MIIFIFIKKEILLLCKSQKLFTNLLKNLGVILWIQEIK